MALQASGAISLGDARTASGKSGAVSMSEFRWNSSNYSLPTAGSYRERDASFPASGAISLSDFHGKYQVYTLYSANDLGAAKNTFSVADRIEFQVGVDTLGTLKLYDGTSPDGPWTEFYSYTHYRVANNVVDLIDGSLAGSVFNVTPPTGAQYVKAELNVGGKLSSAVFRYQVS